MRKHRWGPMTRTKFQGQFFSICEHCGSRIYGSYGSKPNKRDLEFQGILLDCNQQLTKNIMES